MEVSGGPWGRVYGAIYMMNKTMPTYTELIAENAQLQRRVAELEDLVRGLTQQVAEVLRSFPKRGTRDYLEKVG